MIILFTDAEINEHTVSWLRCLSLAQGDTYLL